MTGVDQHEEEKKRSKRIFLSRERVDFFDLPFVTILAHKILRGIVHFAFTLRIFNQPTNQPTNQPQKEQQKKGQPAE
jgi:hypothetical protein